VNPSILAAIVGGLFAITIAVGGGAVMVMRSQAEAIRSGIEVRLVRIETGVGGIQDQVGDVRERLARLEATSHIVPPAR